MPTDGLARRRELFHARNQEYLREGLDRRASARFVARAAGTLRGPALDVGTGKGLLAIELARQALDVVSQDVDAEEQALAALLAEEAGVARRIRFVRGDAARVACSDGHFGCAAMMDVLHHLQDPEPVLREMGRCVGPGGVVVLADFTPEGFEIVARVHRASGREHPVSGATIAMGREMLRGMGLVPVLETRAQHHELLVVEKG
ncbi:MAG: class I SAM-dependent methyltransferase [Deltaproteobacteria bacterium]|nr:class I SAM-dependent methyltransferase [Deltaproteobacteria bacterium]